MTPSQAKQFIKKQIRRWSCLVTSYGWKFDVCYCDNSRSMPDNDHNNIAGYTYSSPEYLDGKIYFDLSVCAELSESELEEVVIHEITHLLLGPMQRDNGKEATERCVTMVSRLFKGLR